MSCLLKESIIGEIVYVSYVWGVMYRVNMFGGSEQD